MNDIQREGIVESREVFKRCRRFFVEMHLRLDKDLISFANHSCCDEPSLKIFEADISLADRNGTACGSDNERKGDGTFLRGVVSGWSCFVTVGSCGRRSFLKFPIARRTKAVTRTNCSHGEKQSSGRVLEMSR